MIPAGTEIRDADGNLIVAVVKDIHVGEANDHRSFRLPNGECPDEGGEMPKEVVDFLEAHGLRPT